MIEQKLVDNIRTHGIYTDSDEGKCKVIENIGFRIGEKAEYVIITGCAPELIPHIFQAIKKLLDYFRIDYTLLRKEYCCGWGPLGQPAVISKNERDITKAKELSREFILENFRQAEELGAKSIVLSCAACEPSYTNCAGDTGLETISYSELLDRYFNSGRLDLEVDYYAGCYRFRRRMTTEPLDVEPAVRVLNKIKGLRVNHLDNKLCCYIPPHFEQLITSIKNETVITICNGCYRNLRDKLQDKGNYQVRILPEVLLKVVGEH